VGVDVYACTIGINYRGWMVILYRFEYYKVTQQLPSIARPTFSARKQKLPKLTRRVHWWGAPQGNRIVHISEQQLPLVVNDVSQCKTCLGIRIRMIDTRGEPHLWPTRIKYRRLEVRVVK